MQRLKLERAQQIRQLPCAELGDGGWGELILGIPLVSLAPGEMIPELQSCELSLSTARYGFKEQINTYINKRKQGDEMF